MRLDFVIFRSVSIERVKSPEEFFQKYPPFTDHDDTMSATKDLVTKDYNEKYARKKRDPTEIRSYRSVLHWLIEDGYSLEDATYFETRLWFDPDLLYQAKPVEGAVEFSYRVHQHGFKLPVISARSDYGQITPKEFKNMHESTVAWYEKWMPWVSPDDIHIQKGNKLPSNINKVLMLKVMGAGSYFEDAVFQADTILAYTDIKVYLLSNMVLASQPKNSNLIQIYGNNGDLPNMKPVYEMFFGKNDWVAQY